MAGGGNIAENGLVFNSGGDAFPHKIWYSLFVYLCRVVQDRYSSIWATFWPYESHCDSRGFGGYFCANTTLSPDFNAATRNKNEQTCNIIRNSPSEGNSRTTRIKLGESASRLPSSGLPASLLDFPVQKEVILHAINTSQRLDACFDSHFPHRFPIYISTRVPRVHRATVC